MNTLRYSFYSEIKGKTKKCVIWKKRGFCLENTIGFVDFRCAAPIRLGAAGADVIPPPGGSGWHRGISHSTTRA